MKRKEFLTNSFLGGGSILAASIPGIALAQKNSPDKGQTFNLNYGFHQGMFENHAGKDFLEQIKFGFDQGFRSIEDNEMPKRTPEMQSKIGDLLARLGMQMGVFVVAINKWPPIMPLTKGEKQWEDKFIASCHEAVEVAKRCHAKHMTVVPGDFARDLSMGLQTSNVVRALRKAADVFEPHGLIMVLEPLSDTPDLFLRFSDQTYEICKAVNSPSCKILFDMYHMQKNEGNLIANIDAYYDEIAYFQIGDNPGRNEPGSGEVNYKNIFKHLYEKGHKGVMGMEHGMSGKGKEGELALIKAYRDADAFR